MRKTSNVRSAIVAPEFANLKLYNDCYKVTVSLRISEDAMYSLHSVVLDAAEGFSAFTYRGRHYLHWEKTYGFDVPFSTAFLEAQHAFVDLQYLYTCARIELLEAHAERLLSRICAD